MFIMVKLLGVYGVLKIFVYFSPSEWTSWSSWLPCSVSCGIGRRQRMRQCNGIDCNNNNTQFQVDNCTAPVNNCPG